MPFGHQTLRKSSRHFSKGKVKLGCATDLARCCDLEDLWQLQAQIVQALLLHCFPQQIV